MDEISVRRIEDGGWGSRIEPQVVECLRFYCFCGIQMVEVESRPGFIVMGLP